jgi:very-short-patch-repair endonuclease
MNGTRIKRSERATGNGQRDRELMRLGFRGVRFTGAEVPSNADACVSEAAAPAYMQ